MFSIVGYPLSTWIFETFTLFRNATYILDDKPEKRKSVSIILKGLWTNDNQKSRHVKPFNLKARQMGLPSYPAYWNQRVAATNLPSIAFHILNQVGELVKSFFAKIDPISFKRFYRHFCMIYPFKVTSLSVSATNKRSAVGLDER